MFSFQRGSKTEIQQHGSFLITKRRFLRFAELDQRSLDSSCCANRGLQPQSHKDAEQTCQLTGMRSPSWRCPIGPPTWVSCPEEITTGETQRRINDTNCWISSSLLCSADHPGFLQGKLVPSVPSGSTAQLLTAQALHTDGAELGLVLCS